MLVLSRKLGEKIVIGDNIVLTVVAIKGNQIRVGVEAPRTVSVWRGELLLDQQPTVVSREEELCPA
jgi:carbon storage regulator